MRYTLLAALVFGSAAFAQHNQNPIGFNGNVLHPGIPLSGPPRASAPAFRNGGGRTGSRRPFAGGGAVYVPYPIYGYGFDGYYDQPPSSYDPGYSGATPTIIINQNFQTDTVRPQFRDYSNTPLPEPGTVLVPPTASAAPQRSQPVPELADDQPTIFLIAMQDHTILPVIAYWVQGDTLHYIGVRGEPNQVGVALVDRDFSKQLNAERHVPFALPAAR